jgi:putative ABC transport system permease protein
MTAIVSRPSRAIAAVAGVLLGVAWWVATLGLASTAAGQLMATFSSRLATQVRVIWSSAGMPIPLFPFPPDAQQRLSALGGVIAAGVYWQVKPARPGQIPVIAATPGFLRAAGAQISSGRPFDAWDQAHSAPVCLLGASAARALHLDGPGTVIDVSGLACVVIGILGGSGTLQPPPTSLAPLAPLAGSVLLPAATAISTWGPPDESGGSVPSLLMRVRPGAAAQVAREAPYALSPASPGRFRTQVPPSPVRLGAAVSAANRRLFAVLSRTSLVIGSLVVVLSGAICALGRTAEFGLRRACGARRRHITAQVLAETATLGLLGGLAGAGLGVAIVVLVARAERWVPVIDPIIVLPAPLGAAGAAMLAGVAGSLRGAWSAPGKALDAGAMMPG